MAILPEDLGRAGYALEASFKGSPGSVQNLSQLVALEGKGMRARVARPILLNSAGDTYADKPGHQSFEGSFEVEASDLIVTELGRVLQSIMGEKVAGSSLTFSSASTNVSVTVSAGTLDNIVRITGDDGQTYHRPGTVSGNTLTYKIKIPAGVTATNVKNASQTTGELYRDNNTGAVDTYQFIVDEAGYTGESPIKGQGCVFGPARLIYTLNGLLKWGFDIKGAVFSNLAGASGLADTGAGTQSYMADVVSFALQDFTTPAVIAPLELKALDLSMGYDFIPLTAGTGASGGTNPGSNVTGYIRKKRSFEKAITCTFHDTAGYKAWEDAVGAGTAYQLWAEFYPGNPGASTGSTRHCIWIPRVKPVKADKVKVDGVWCVQLELMAERESGLKRGYLDLFGTT